MSTLLLTGAAVASAAPAYPPSAPSSSVRPSLGTDDESASRDGNANQQRPVQTANTGFDTLTASLIATVLLVGGGALIVAGRRRRHG